MGPKKAAARAISQQAFDEMVQENIDDLGMDPTEALEDAIQTLTLQGVDLSGMHLRLYCSALRSLTRLFKSYCCFPGIVTCVPGESNPVVECLGKLKEDKALPEIVELVDELGVLCEVKESGNAAIASKNGAVELIISICIKLRDERHRGLASGLNVLASLIHGMSLSCTLFDIRKLKLHKRN